MLSTAHLHVLLCLQIVFLSADSARNTFSAIPTTATTITSTTTTTTPTTTVSTTTPATTTQSTTTTPATTTQSTTTTPATTTQSTITTQATTGTTTNAPAVTRAPFIKGQVAANIYRGTQPNCQIEACSASVLVTYLARSPIHCATLCSRDKLCLYYRLAEQVDGSASSKICHLYNLPPTIATDTFKYLGNV